MTDEQKEIIAIELYRLKTELDKLERTPKRGQQFNHYEHMAFIRGRIRGLQSVFILLAPADPNVIEQ